jgi:hypothetical protein
MPPRRAARSGRLSWPLNAEQLGDLDRTIDDIYARLRAIQVATGAGGAARYFLGGTLSDFMADTAFVDAPESYEFDVDFDAAGAVYFEVNAVCRVSASVTLTAKLLAYDTTAAAWLEVAGSELDVVLDTAFVRTYKRTAAAITKPTGTRRVKFQFKGSTGAGNTVAAVGFLAIVP